MKTWPTWTIRFVLFSLTFGLFSVPNQVNAVDSITKTFTIRGADNSLLSGAQVRFYWSDPETGVQIIGTPASSNASGVVTLAAPLNAKNLNYTVFPAITDRVNALQKDTVISSSASGSVNVKLEAANLFVNVQKSDGSNVTGGAVLIYPELTTHTWNRSTFVLAGTAAASVIRSGSVGVRVAQDLNTSSDYILGILQYTDNYQPGEFSWRFGLKANGIAGNQSYTVYSDSIFSGSTLTPVDGAYVLKYSAANIIGTLKNSDGSTFTFSDGMNMTTTLSASGWTPSTFPPAGSTDFTDYQKSPNANWFARGLGAAGKYQLTFAFGGSTSIPSFSTFIWKNAFGGWSLSEAGPFVGDSVTPANIEVRRPADAPNFALDVVAKDSQLALPSSLNLERLNGDGTSTYISTPRLLNGKFSAVLPAGNYSLGIFPNDASYYFKKYLFTVTGSIISSFKDSANNDVVPTGVIYKLELTGPNLNGTFKDTSGNDLVLGQNQWIDLGVQKKVDGGWRWTNIGNRFTTSVWELNIDEVGEFRLVARPAGFSGISDSYSESIFVTSGSPKKLSLVSEAAASSGTTTALTGISITMRLSNLKMSITDPRDNSLLKYGWVAILLKSNNGDQSWIGNADIRSTAPGLADFKLDDGNYRLEVNPQFNGTLISGLARKYYDVVVSGSGTSVIVSSNGVALSPDGNGRVNLTPAAANVTGKVTDQAGNALVGSSDKWVSINVQMYDESRKEFTWSSNWSNTDQNGDFSISVTDPGKYRLRVQPTGFTGVSIFYSQEFTIVNGSEKFDFASLKSPSPSLTGTIFAPDGTTPIKDARVRVINTVNNQELWQYEAFTSSSGLWSMNLPAGSYSLYAAAPYGSSSYGNSDKIGTVTVNTSGVATLNGDAASGRTSTTFNISLRNPTWSGVVKNPGNSAAVPYAQVCLYTNSIWNCTDSNSAGEWALSAPVGFTAFSADAFVQIADWRGRIYPQRRYGDASAALGGLTASNRILNFQQANVSIKVTGSGGAPVSDVWVTLIRPGFGWLAGNNTNSSGVALINVDDLTKALEVRIEIGGNSQASGVYASEVKNFSASEVSINAAANSNIFTTAIQLSAPNVSGVVREPNAVWANGATVADAWIELFNDTTNEFITSSSAGFDGKFALNAPKPVSGEIEYRMIINPAWNATTSFSKQSYKVVVNSDGTVTVTIGEANTAVSTSGGSYSLSLAIPNVSGTVVGAGDLGVANSWVVPIVNSTNEYYWQYGTNTKSAGNFGMNLPDGSYRLDANLPWNATGVAKPAPCTVTIAGGVITSPASGCVVVASDSSKSVKLALRTPNVTFTLKQGGQAVVGANVSIGLGNWNTSAQSNINGVVSLFIDPAEIASKTGMSGVKDLRVWVDPPWGTSSMVRWDCNSGDSKPICSSLTDVDLAATAYPTIPNADVTVLGPNTKILIKDPRTNLSVGANAWISIFSYEPSNPSAGQRWAGGSNTDSDGFAAFNIETITATTRFKVEVNPPWNSRVSLAQKVWDNTGAGYTDVELTTPGISLSLGLPNAIISIKSSDGVSANKWGWIGIEEVDPSTNNPITWIGGYGLNDTGTAAVTLSASKRYKVIANPSYGRPGVQTLCYVETDSSTALSLVTGLCSSGTLQSGTNKLNVNLVAGNVAGIVSYEGAAVANAIVYANLLGASNDDNAVFAATLANGSFGFDLDFTGGKQWVIKIFPYNEEGKTALANQTLATVTGPNPSIIVTLMAKP